MMYNKVNSCNIMMCALRCRTGVLLWWLSWSFLTSNGTNSAESNIQKHYISPGLCSIIPTHDSQGFHFEWKHLNHDWCLHLCIDRPMGSELQSLHSLSLGGYMEIQPPPRVKLYTMFKKRENWHSGSYTSCCIHYGMSCIFVPFLLWL